MGGVRFDYSPNAVLIAMGTILNGRGATDEHRLKASIGSGGRCMLITFGRKDAIDTANLVNARAPKYTIRTLFPKVIPYILGWSHIRQSGDKMNTANLNMIKTSEDVK